MAKHIVPGMGERTYYIWPLMIPTPRWWDHLTGAGAGGKKWNPIVARIDERLNRMKIRRGKSVLYD